MMPRCSPPAFVDYICADDLGQLSSQRDTEDGRRVRNNAVRQLFIDDHDTFFIRDIHAFPLFCK